MDLSPCFRAEPFHIIRPLNRPDTQSTVHVYPTGRNAPPVVRTWMFYVFKNLYAEHNEAKCPSKQSHRVTNTCRCCIWSTFG